MEVKKFLHPTSLIKLSTPFLTLVLCSPAWPVVTLIPDCPEKFVGKVAQVADESLTQSSLSKVQVSIEVEKYLSGKNPQKEKRFEVLKYGNIQFVPGKFYVVSLNKNHLCMAEKIDSLDF